MDPNPKPGDIVHFEINTKDAGRAKTFYTKLFGWKYKDSDIPGIEYYLIDGATPGGAINPQTTAAKAPVIYFGVDDVDKSVKIVRDQGGKAGDKIPIPGQGWFSECTDLDGNAFSLFQNDPSVTMETEHAHQEART
jgi:predicted enzyme related to lactoylglutathione lyase